MVSTKLKLRVFLSQRKRHSRAVVQRCIGSPWKMFFKIGVLEKFATFTEKTPAWESLFNKRC